ncbi:MAG: cation diffusion facilitator family transporter [Alphaproteobacteria bacterium]|nr:cation diffusion facilitator family transporter [Alphaproteobacteria bacterium]MCB9695405.1 cation diffusion facilitator family transporter [Alphaproteobacteria bacterium]
MAGADHDSSHIFQSLAVNLVIAIGKGVCAFLTGSGALLAETIHSFADCGNQILLLVGVRKSAKPPDETHPLGYGRALYFWSFLVAMLLFSGGGVFSVYEGFHKMHEHGEESGPTELLIGLGMLAFSLLLEGWATIGNVRELNKRRGQRGFVEYLRFTKDSDLVVIFGENSAAVLGLGFALGGLGMTHLTHDPVWDAYATVAIGTVLIGVALFLAVEIMGLLVGEAADPEIRRDIDLSAGETSGVTRVLRVITLQQGPGEVLVACKVAIDGALSGAQVVASINDFERRVKEKRPEVRWLFVEPDDHA